MLGSRHGYRTETGPDIAGGISEADTYTCQHCNHVHRVAAGAKGQMQLTWCKKCMGLVCPACAALPCDPMAAKLERWEAMRDWRPGQALPFNPYRI